jgi:predicted DNA-binding antitoxin AbrB/MazE fold protein
MVPDILNRPHTEVSKISVKGDGGWEAYSKVSWDEYRYLDWVAIGTVNVLDIVPLGKVAKSGGGMVKTVIGAGDTAAFNVGQIRDEWWSYFVNNKQFGRVDSLEPPIAVSMDYLKYSNGALKPLTKEKIKETVKLQLSTTNTTAVLNWVRTFDDFLTNRLKADNWAYLEDPDPLLLIGIPLDNAIFTACVWLNGVAYRPAGGK